MNNEEINQKLTEAENKKIELFKRKTELERKVADVKDELRQANIEFAEANMRISQLRRNFKLEGYKTRALRLSQDEKDMIIAEVGHCEECPSKIDLTVHHIKPLSHGGTNERSNLKVICLDCHRRYHKI